MKHLRWQMQVAVGFVIVMTGIHSGQAETVGAPVEEKTLQEFQREYSGTKPIVAFEKYQAYRKARRVGRVIRTQPTTGVSGESPVQRADKTFNDFLQESGTKPVVAVERYQAYRKARRAGRVDVMDVQPAVLTLGPSDESRMQHTEKTLSGFMRAYSFTKPSIGAQKYLEYRSRQ